MVSEYMHDEWLNVFIRENVHKGDLLELSKKGTSDKVRLFVIKSFNYSSKVHEWSSRYFDCNIGTARRQGFNAPAMPFEEWLVDTGFCKPVGNIVRASTDFSEEASELIKTEPANAQ